MWWLITVKNLMKRPVCLKEAIKPERFMSLGSDDNEGAVYRLYHATSFSMCFVTVVIDNSPASVGNLSSVFFQFIGLSRIKGVYLSSVSLFLLITEGELDRNENEKEQERARFLFSFGRYVTCLYEFWSKVWPYAQISSRSF